MVKVTKNQRALKIILPKDYCEVLGIKGGDKLFPSISKERKSIILRKWQ